MDNSLKSSINAAISEATAKSAQKSEGDFAQRTEASKVQAAQARINTAESKLTKYKNDKALNDQAIANPPMKDVSTGGKNGGTKQVVEQTELNKLKQKDTQIKQQIAQAERDVEEAREEAQAAANAATEKAGITQELQTEIDSLMSKANSLGNQMSKGEELSEDDISEFIEDFNTLAGKTTAEDNAGGILSQAVFNPVKETLKDIKEYLETEQVDTDSTAEVDTNNLDPAQQALLDVGISLEAQDEHFTLADDLSNFEKGLGENYENFDAEAFEALKDRQVAATQSLSETQKNTGVIKENSDIIGRIEANVAAGSGDSGGGG